METLLDALTRYAEENLVPRFRQETAGASAAAQRRAARLTDQLDALNPAAKQLLEELKVEWDTVSDGHCRAVLLAGISIGLELGRFS